jgi:hypothetical protein
MQEDSDFLRIVPAEKMICAKFFERFQILEMVLCNAYYNNEFSSHAWIGTYVVYTGIPYCSSPPPTTTFFRSHDHAIYLIIIQLRIVRILTVFDMLCLMG